MCSRFGIKEFLANALSLVMAVLAVTARYHTPAKFSVTLRVVSFGALCLTKSMINLTAFVCLQNGIKRQLKIVNLYEITVFSAIIIIYN